MQSTMYYKSELSHSARNASIQQVKSMLSLYGLLRNPQTFFPKIYFPNTRKLILLVERSNFVLKKKRKRSGDRPLISCNE